MINVTLTFTMYAPRLDIVYSPFRLFHTQAGVIFNSFAGIPGRSFFGEGLMGRGTDLLLGVIFIIIVTSGRSNLFRTCRDNLYDLQSLYFMLNPYFLFKSSLSFPRMFLLHECFA